MVIVDISAKNLQQAYLDANQNVLLFQQYIENILVQQPLNLTENTVLAHRVSTFQSQFKEQAISYRNIFMPEYITSLTSGLNFYTAFKSFVTNVEQLIRQSSADQASSLAVELSKIADETNQRINTAVQKFGVVNNSLSQLQSEFDSALDMVISKLGDSKIAINQDIDKLKNTLNKNIDGIVEGSVKFGGAVYELGIGVLKNITNIEAGNIIPGEFVVSAITAAQKGTAQSAQASADFDSNNKELNTAYQTLEQKNSLLAIATVIQFNNKQFISKMKETELKISNIAAIWGQSPVISPGSGISLGFDQYAQQINAITTPSDIDQLLELLQQAAISWKSLRDELNNIKQELVRNH
mgnify:CR=1 FL=1